MRFYTSQELAMYFRISEPLKEFKISQLFGANLVDFYKTLGIDGHNGLDLRAPTGTPVYAVNDGEILAYADISGGIAVELFTAPIKIEGVDVRLRIIYYHLLRYLVKTGDKVKKGQNIALADNTGRYTTGAHLHLGVKAQYLVNGAWIQDNNNGYKGAIDPLPLFYDDYSKLPVDRRYGKTFNWLQEFFMRFITPEVHRALINRGRHPLSLENRELNALVYGGWLIEDILNPALWQTWTEREKSFFNK